MSFNIITEAPWWYVLICIVAGFAYSFLLYRNDSRFADVNPALIRLMAVLRFTAVFILCFLLMSPLIKTVNRELEKPILILIQDESSSVTSVRDSASFKSGYRTKLENVINALEDDYDIRPFSVGSEFREGITYGFGDSETDLSSPVTELRSRFAGRNVGAVVLATDGLYNRGSNPLYGYPDLKAPVYTIGLGDTTVFRDLMIKSVNHNKTAYLGNTFPVEITLDARKCSGEQVRLSVSKNNKELLSKNISITSNRFNTVLPVFLDASEKGLQKYTVTVQELDNELTYENNTWNFFIEVIDNKQVILCVSNAPHPDLSAIRNIVETNPGYEFRMVQASEFDGNLNNVNLVILHQLPSQSNNISSLIEKTEALELPVWYILGTQTNVQAFNNLNTGVTISENRGNLAELLPEGNRDFSLFTLEDEFYRITSTFPPLISPFGNYSRQGNIHAIFNQKVGSVKTDMPLMYFNVKDNTKLAVLAGEGLWKWRLAEYSATGNTNAVQSLVTKTIQFLSAKEIRTPFRLYYKKSFAENEPVIIDAELYNETGELVNTPDVQISITNQEGGVFPFTFSRTERAYNLNAGLLPSGVYTFKASTRLADRASEFTGSFTVTELQAEKTETVADHGLLQALSSRTGGHFFTSANLEALTDSIRSRDDIRTVSYLQKKLDDLINLKWIFLLLMILLSAEWFMRKRSGAY